MEEFEFKIGMLKSEELPSDDMDLHPKVAIVQGNLRALLETVTLTKDGKDVAVDGFRFIGEDATYALVSSTAK